MMSIHQTDDYSSLEIKKNIYWRIEMYIKQMLISSTHLSSHTEWERVPNFPHTLTTTNTYKKTILIYHRYVQHREKESEKRKKHNNWMYIIYVLSSSHSYSNQEIRKRR